MSESITISDADRSNDLQVVPMNSAVLPGYIPIGIHSNHMDMTKFVSEDDPGFVAVEGGLLRWMREIRTMPGT